MSLEQQNLIFLPDWQGQVWYISMSIFRLQSWVNRPGNAVFPTPRIYSIDCLNDTQVGVTRGISAKNCELQQRIRKPEPTSKQAGSRTTEQPLGHWFQPLIRLQQLPRGESCCDDVAILGRDLIAPFGARFAEVTDGVDNGYFACLKPLTQLSTSPRHTSRR